MLGLDSFFKKEVPKAVVDARAATDAAADAVQAQAAEMAGGIAKTEAPSAEAQSVGLSTNPKDLDADAAKRLGANEQKEAV